MKKQCLFLLLIASHAAFAADEPAPPPSAPVKRSAADLEKLVAPIALYPDPLIATLLPASVYPLEIVQAARFVANTNNLPKLDEQPWDENVKAVARVPEVIKKLNDELPWTMELGEAFLAQDKDLMDAIQTMRAKAQSFGTLKTSPQQVVVVTNVVIEKTVEQKVVVVTNTIVLVQPANPQVIYVPTYSPTVVYAPPPPSYPGLTFAAGVAVGAIIANNNCDYHYGGCYHGGYHGNVNVNRNVNVNANVNYNQNVNAGGKWQPDQSRLSKSGTPTAANTARSKEARGWGSGGAGPSTGSPGARPSTGNTAARPSSGNTSAGPSTGSSSGGRPGSSPSAGTSQAKSSPSAGRSSSPGSAFSGASTGSSARSDSSRGSSSRSQSGSSGGRSRSGGGGRSGGGRR